MDTKLCLLCDEVKPATAFKPSKTTSDCLDVFCKECNRQRKRKPRPTKTIGTSRKCSKCREVKPVSEFSPTAHYCHKCNMERVAAGRKLKQLTKQLPRVESFEIALNGIESFELDKNATLSFGQTKQNLIKDKRYAQRIDLNGAVESFEIKL